MSSSAVTTVANGAKCTSRVICLYVRKLVNENGEIAQHVHAWIMQHQKNASVNYFLNSFMR